MSLLNVPAGKELPEDIYVVIEIPANADPIKYEVDKESGALFVDRFMSTAMFYPCNYGYINHTLSLDGDPVDVLVPTPYPLQPRSHSLPPSWRAENDRRIRRRCETGCGTAHQTEQRVRSHQRCERPARTAESADHSLLRALQRPRKGKWVKVDGWDNAEAAKAEIIASFERAAKK